MNKKYITWLIVVALLTFPLILNYIIQRPAFFPIVGTPESWLMFWATYLGAAASAGMIYVTYRTLKNNREQLNEMKRQWDEEHKPNVSVSFNRLGTVAYLRIVNTSVVEVKNLRIKGEFFDGENKSDFFNMSILDQFNIDIEPYGVRNIILHDKIEPLNDNLYFILELYYNGIDKPKVVKVHCNNVYMVGDVIQWRQLIESIYQIRLSL